MELADFVAYADKVVAGIQKYFNTDVSTYQEKRYVCQRSTLISRILTATPLFQNKKQPLYSLLNEKYKIQDHQAHDLSVIVTVGSESLRMKSYCEKYVLGDESPKKRKKNPKLHTFTQHSNTNREQNSKVKQLEEINQNALQALKSSGVSVQTSPFPLALATLDGSMCTGCKSSFRRALESQTPFSDCFTNIYHYLQTIYVWHWTSCALFTCHLQLMY